MKKWTGCDRMSENNGSKECKKCKRLLPADMIHFNRKRDSKDGLHNICKECRGSKFRIPYTYGVLEGERKCSRCGIIYPATNEHFSYSDKEHKHFMCICKKCAAEKQKNNPKRNETIKRFHENHPESYVKKMKRRYDLLHNNGFVLTNVEWQENLEYFDHSCAYCRSKENITKDHVIPLTKGGTTSKSNVIPACNSCNTSKLNHDFENWYKKQSFFTDERFNKIMNLINSEEST